MRNFVVNFSGMTAPRGAIRARAAGSEVMVPPADAPGAIQGR